MSMVSVNDYLSNVSQKVRSCPTPTLQRAYVRALRDWCQQTQWLRTNINGATEANVAQYSLGSDPDRDVMGIYAMQGSFTIPPSNLPQTWPIGAAQDPGGWNPAFQPAQPLQYTYVPEGEFALFPTPNAVFQLLITAIIAPKEQALSIPAEPLVKYSNDIEAGALAYLLAINGMPWTDKAEAQWQGKLFSAGISNGKAEVQRKYNTGPARARPRAFLMGGGGGYYP